MDFFGEGLKGAAGLIAGDNRERSSREMRSKENLHSTRPSINVGNANPPRPPVMRKTNPRPPVLRETRPPPPVETPHPQPGENKTPPRPPNFIGLAYPCPTGYPPLATTHFSLIDTSYANPLPPSSSVSVEKAKPPPPLVETLRPPPVENKAPSPNAARSLLDRPYLNPWTVALNRLPDITGVEDFLSLPSNKIYKVDDPEFYSKTNYEGEEIKPEICKLVKRYLKQVEESGGYDVDCRLPVFFYPSYRPVYLNKDVNKGIDSAYDALFLKPVRSAIERINAQLRRNFELLEIQRVVETGNCVQLLTFTAKEEVPDGDAHVETFQAKVDARPWEKYMTLMGWRVKPFPTDSGGDC